jgi:hypothetical protein
MFIGRNYERAFDEFEILFALVVFDNRKQSGGWLWGPVGRFGWKQFNCQHPPFTRLIEEAKASGNEWPPLKAGLFGGSVDRFVTVAEDFQKEVLAHLRWF